MSVLTDAAYWLIQFEENGKTAEIFTDETRARARYEQLQLNWACHLFVQAEIIDHLRQERADAVQALLVARDIITGWTEDVEGRVTIHKDAIFKAVNAAIEKLQGGE